MRAYSSEDLIASGAMLGGLEVAIGRLSRSLGLAPSEIEDVLPE
jgi:hypothetical protein